MKRARRVLLPRAARRHPHGPYAEVPNQFVRGAIAAGLLTALQGAAQARSRGQARARVLKRALQGGTALAAGVAMANALDFRRYGSAGATLLAGALGVAMLERLFDDTNSGKDEDHG